MIIYGIDFTSSPKRSKPITCLECRLEGNKLEAHELIEWRDFDEFEGAPRLLEAGVTIPGLQQGDRQRIVVEAYPGVLARSLIGRRSYKQDTKKKQTQDQQEAREELLKMITDDGVLATHGLLVEAPISLADDPGADHLDALLCAIQAGWAWIQRDTSYGAITPIDKLEGWIADPVAQKP